VKTAKSNGLDVYPYLLNTLTELPYLVKNPNPEDLDTFMPWSSTIRKPYKLPVTAHPTEDL